MKVISYFQKNTTNLCTKNGMTYNKESLHEALEMVETDKFIQKATKKNSYPGKY